MKGLRSASSVSLVFAFAFFASHLPSLAPSLEDIDSINFALGLRDFDVASHQPHPPGYPVYIALGRVSRAGIHAVASVADVRAEALALSVWSAAGGAVAVWAAWALFASFRAPSGTALWAAALLAMAPLFWIAGLRPMSDLPGLALVLLSQALIVRGADRPSLVTWGALVAGLAAGVRVQTLLLTVPLVVLRLCRDPGSRNGSGRLAHPRLARWSPGEPDTIKSGRARVLRSTLVPLAALAAGVLVWLVPLLFASGGPAGYVRALATQAGEDFAAVDMLWSNPTPRRLALSLYETLVLPWSIVPLAAAVGAAAVAGAVAAVARNRASLLLLLVAFGPYIAFHLLLQETFTVRYALPVLPAVAWLAARGAFVTGRFAPAIGAALVAFAAAVSLPAGVAYGSEAHPAFRAIADMRAAAAAEPPAAIHAHYSLRRPLQAEHPHGVPFVEPPRQMEWLGLTDYWRSGGSRVIWFLADPRRTDLDLIDPQARHPIKYRWSVGDRPELSGTRPLDVDWYQFEPPGWFAGEGWSLTPETGGIAQATGVGLDRRPIEAYVRAGRGALRVMIGGGYLDPAALSRRSDRGGAYPVAFDLSIDGVPADAWTLAPDGDGRFLRFFELGELARGDGYATLRITARSTVAGGLAAPVAVRQFDVQPVHRLVYGFGEGWHQEEYDSATGRRWRWTSGRSVIRVAPAQAVRLTLRGESPLRYFDEPPAVRVTANGRTAAAFRPDAAFERQVLVGAEDVAAAGGAIVIEVDPVYRPAEAEGSADTRQLGLRLFNVAVHPVSP